MSSLWKMYESMAPPSREKLWKFARGALPYINQIQKCMKGGGLPLKFSYKCMLHFPQDHFGDKVKMYEETGGTPPPPQTYIFKGGGLLLLLLLLFGTILAETFGERWLETRGWWWWWWWRSCGQVGWKWWCWWWWQWWGWRWGGKWWWWWLIIDNW